MKQRHINHILFWTLYLAFEIYTEFEWVMIQHHFTVQHAFTAAATAETLLVVLVKIPMVYLLFYMFNRYAGRRSNRPMLVGSCSVILVVFSFLSRSIIVNYFFPEVYQLEIPPYFFEFQGLINAFMDIIFIAGVALALKMHSNNNRLIQREKALMQEKLETELNFLKAQINPHFLFNTLNSIYALALQKSDDTSGVVVKLSKLLRFVLYEAQARKITIGREIQFLNDYIELEKIRYDKRLEVQFDYKADPPDAQIVPLILIPLVENAFKHGASETTSQAFIRIELELEQNRLVFKVDNSFEYETEEKPQGIGLKNLRRQLEILYPDFDLQTEITGRTFKAKLLLDLNQ
ncbi:sensor histidine kinase [Flavobacterium sp.]|uniref:sensor histidine kinase n=1 Tax=Flavobacterium sp. TaxID=239 RepID=UPI0039E72212